MGEYLFLSDRNVREELYWNADFFIRVFVSSFDLGICVVELVIIED
jgi:hypothetical protein